MPVLKSIEPLSRPPLLHVTVQESLQEIYRGQQAEGGRSAAAGDVSRAATRRRPQLGARGDQGAGIDRHSGDAPRHRRVRQGILLQAVARQSGLRPAGLAARCRGAARDPPRARDRADRQDHRDDQRRGHRGASPADREHAPARRAQRELCRGGPAVPPDAVPLPEQPHAERADRHLLGGVQQGLGLHQSRQSDAAGHLARPSRNRRGGRRQGCRPGTSAGSTITTGVSSKSSPKTAQPENAKGGNHAHQDDSHCRRAAARHRPADHRAGTEVQRPLPAVSTSARAAFPRTSTRWSRPAASPGSAPISNRWSSGTPG